MDCSTQGFPVHHELLELTQTHVHRVGDAIQPSHPLSSPSSLAFNLSQHQGLFQWVSSSHQVAKLLEFQLQHQVLPMNIQDWFPLGWTDWISLQSKGLSRIFSNTTVQKHWFFQRSPFFMVQLSYPYMTTVKTTALTIQTFVSKVTPQLFNMLSILVIAYLSCLQSPSAMILEPPKIKSATVSTVSPSISHEVMGPDSPRILQC